MFEGLDGLSPSQPVDMLLQRLESQLSMLSDEDQGFVIGCRHHVDSAMPLTADNIQQLQRIAGRLVATGHNTVGLGAPISIPRVLKDLGQNLSRLNDVEKNFAVGVAKKLKGGIPLAPVEIEQLLRLHAAKV